MRVAEAQLQAARTVRPPPPPSERQRAGPCAAGDVGRQGAAAGHQDGGAAGAAADGGRGGGPSRRLLDAAPGLPAGAAPRLPPISQAPTAPMMRGSMRTTVSKLTIKFKLKLNAKLKLINNGEMSDMYVMYIQVFSLLLNYC